MALGVRVTARDPGVRRAPDQGRVGRSWGAGVRNGGGAAPCCHGRGPVGLLCERAAHAQIFRTTTVPTILSAKVCFLASHSGHR